LGDSEIVVSRTGVSLILESSLKDFIL